MDYTRGWHGIRVDEKEKTFQAICRKSGRWEAYGDRVIYPAKESALMLVGRFGPMSGWRIALHNIRRVDIELYEAIMAVIAKPEDAASEQP